MQRRGSQYRTPEPGTRCNLAESRPRRHAAARFCVRMFIAAGLSSATVFNTAKPLSSMPPQARPAIQPHKTENSNAATHLESARKACESRDFSQCRAELELVLQADPQSADAYEMLGALELESGKSAEAKSDFERAAQYVPNSFAAHYNLGLLYLREHDLKRGLPELQRAAALDPHNPSAAYNLGLVLLETGKPQGAVAELRRVQVLGQDRPDVAFNLIRAELAAGHAGAAKLDAEKERKAFGEDPKWLGSVGQLFLEQGQVEDARTYLETAVQLQPRDLETRRALARADLVQQRADPVLELIPVPLTAEDHYLRAKALFLLHRRQGAQEEAEPALRDDPENVSILLLAAQIQQSLGKQDEALKLLASAARLQPNSPEIFYRTAVSYYFGLRYEEAQHYLEKALEQEPKCTRCLSLYANTLLIGGKNREAEDALRRAMALDPTNARYVYHLGAALLRDNRPQDAKPVFEKAIALKPDYGPPHYALGKLLEGEGQSQQAAKELELSVKYEPHLAEAYYQLGRVYSALGEAEKSRQAYRTFENLKENQGSEDQRLQMEITRELGQP